MYNGCLTFGGEHTFIVINMILNHMKFEALNPGDQFEVWGDQHLNYPYPKICVCEKLDSQYAVEVEITANGATQIGAKFLLASDALVLPMNTDVTPAAEYLQNLIDDCQPA